MLRIALISEHVSPLACWGGPDWLLDNGTETDWQVSELRTPDFRIADFDLSAHLIAEEVPA